MKKLVLLVLILLMFMITGCRGDSELDGVNLISKSGCDVFTITLHTDKQEYKFLEPKDIRISMKYIGDEDEVTIYHGDPLVVFSIEGDNGFLSGGHIHDVLINTIFEKNKEYTFAYPQISNSFDLDFYEALHSVHEKELQELPVGNYIVYVNLEFTIGDTDNERTEFEGKIAFSVVQ